MRPEPANLIAVIITLIVGLPFAILWAVALADVVRRRDWEFPGWEPGSNVRMVWAFFVLVFNGPGAIVYYLRVMRQYPLNRR